MDFEKILKYIISLVIIGYVIYLAFPSIEEFVVGTKEVVNTTQNEFKYSAIINYMASKPDYYFEYDGAVYCIPVKQLIDESVITESKEYQIDKIVEVSIVNKEYFIQVKEECIEK